MLEAIRKIMVLAAAVVMPFLCAAPAAHASSVRPIRSGQAGGSEVVSQPNGSAVSTQKAKKVNLSVYSVLQSTDYSPVLDDNEWTYKTMSRNITLHIYGDKAFSSLYLKFELPNEWMVTLPDGTGLEGGKNDFIHEWLPLGQSVKNVDLSLAKNTKLTDIYAFTDGELPSWVQVWQPPCENADLMVMPTHSDDEHLWFGGAMPYYAGERGYKVQVVYMTNHRQYTIRCHEQLNGLWAVGVTHYPIISDTFRDVPATGRYDKAAEIFGYDNVLGFQVEMLRRFRPKVIIAHDINGEYGHGAHRLNARTLLEALELTDDPAAFPESAAKYGTCQVQKVYLHLWEEHPIVMDWSKMELSRFGGKTAMDMTKKGFACHVSQQGHYRVAEDGPYDCRKFGLAYTTVGWDTPDQNDMFEHVVWSEGRPDAEDEPSGAVAVSSSDGAVSASDTPPAATHRQMAWIAAVSAVVVLAAASVWMLHRKGRRGNALPSDNPTDITVKERRKK